MWQGLGVALITLFDKEGRLEAEATAEHAVRLVELGVHMVLVCGGSGEASSLTPEERVKLIRTVRSALPSTVPVIAGTGTDSTATAVELTNQGCKAGADAVLAISPRDSRDLVGYYTALARAADPLPLIAYHNPAISPPGIPLEVLPKLPVAGLKDSSRDSERIAAEIAAWSGSVFVGSTTMLDLAHNLGGAGAILGIANAAPELCVAALEGDPEAHQALLDSRESAGRNFPLGLKELTAARFGTSTVVRRLKTSD